MFAENVDKESVDFEARETFGSRLRIYIFLVFVYRRDEIAAKFTWKIIEQVIPRWSYSISIDGKERQRMPK